MNQESRIMNYELRIMKKGSGQTLLEALIALATAVVIISAMSVLVLSSLNNAQFSKNQNQATQYAQQGIEFLKNQGQSNWTSFTTNYNLTNYCMSADNSISPKPVPPGCAQSPFIINNLFVREVTIYQQGDLINNTCDPLLNSALVTVSVGWKDNKCSATDYCHKVKLVSCIYNQIAVPTP